MGQFQHISLPLVRRVYPQLIADKIVSVQPMTEPTGLVYYLRHKYSTNKQTLPAIPEGTPTRKKQIKRKKYRSIDDPWERNERNK